jgi:hypothetical protein
MTRFLVLAVVLSGAACASRQPMPARGDPAAPELAVPDDGTKLIFAGKADGVQIYGCAAKAEGGYDWKLKGPEAGVVSDTGAKLHHYAGPTWEASDGSKVVGEAKAKTQVDPGAIPWLLLGAKATSGAGLLEHARWVQRFDTRGGKAPDDGCDADRSGSEVRIAYTAVYRIWGQ